MIFIELAGRLGKDPETRVTPKGNKVTELLVATNIRTGDKDETVWWRVNVWGSDFDNMIKHLKKGSAIIVKGDMAKAPETYTDKEGQQRVTLRLTARYLRFNPFGGGKGERSEQSQPAGYSASATATYSQPYGGVGIQNGFGQVGDQEATLGAFGSPGQYVGGATGEGEEEAPPF